MGETKKLTCINCPIGCELCVELSEKGRILNIDGNKCPRGKAYAEKEITAPTRIVTSVVHVCESVSGNVMVSCKTASDIPKGKIFEIVQELKNVCVKAPVHIGDVIKTNVANTGVDVIATRNID